MKDSVRENLFNILGPAVKGSICFDLFAGTGALALESISRGAVLSFAVEQSRLAVRVLRETSEEIGVADQLRVLHGDTFRLADRLLSGPVDGFDEQAPWIVYLCPPYRMWEDELDRSRLNGLIESTRRNGPPGSLVVAETERRFDPDLLPTAEWDLREYGDTRLAILEIEP